MKTSFNHIVRCSFMLGALLALKTLSYGQGRVVVNEFMPWSGCNTTSEFIELMNFGPGPMNIGCYIVTNGQYAVTIPANTIVQAGDYYILSGQNTLSQGCGNIDSTVVVDLNWSTCNCSNAPIPTTGDGFMKNGGSSNEKIVVLAPNLTVVDAVSRSSTPSTSVSITTASVGGSCTPKTFDLTTMPIAYEAVNVATGIDNSYARRIDGDCGWVKTTDISANARNKTGSTASASYTFSTLSASQCSGTTGSISINVSATNVATLFPMSYTIAYDADSNNLFDAADQYTYGVDSSSPSIDINNLFYGRYRITVGSSSGCNLQSFDFFIFNCYGVILNTKSLSLKFLDELSGQYRFTYRANVDDSSTVYLQSGDGRVYETIATLNKKESIIKVPRSTANYFRLSTTDDKKVIFYSNEVKVKRSYADNNTLWPNPTRSNLNVQFSSALPGKGSYFIYNATGKELKTASFQTKKGINTISISTNNLPSGLCQLIIRNEYGETANYRFLKQ